MAAPLSIVVPTLDSAGELSQLAAALVEGLKCGLIGELVVSDGGSGDDTVAVAEALGARLIAGPAGRGGQLRRGGAAARGEWLLFLHADSVPEPGWSGAVLDHLQRHPGRAAVFRLRFASGHPMARVTAAWANLRTRLFGLPYGDQGLLIPARLYLEVGGFPDIALMEDVALMRALARRFDLLPATVTTSAARYEREGWIRRGAKNLGIVARYLAGASPRDLAARYGGSGQPSN